MFDSSGHFLKEFGYYGNGEGEFDCLAGVAINRIGQYIIVSINGKKMSNQICNIPPFEKQTKKNTIRRTDIITEFKSSIRRVGFCAFSDRKDRPTVSSVIPGVSQPTPLDSSTSAIR